MKMTMNAALLAAVFTTIVALPAQAQAATSTISTSVNARAGLSPALAVTCDAVNFGVWRVPIRNSGGITEITLTVSANNTTGVSTATVGGNTNLVSLDTGYLLPKAATCSVVGSKPVSTNLTTSISGNTGLGFIASNHESLPIPTTLAQLTANLQLGGIGVAVDANGSGSFRVAGTLIIPEVIVVGNYGGYQTGTGTTPSGATVSFVDTR